MNIKKLQQENRLLKAKVKCLTEIVCVAYCDMEITRCVKHRDMPGSFLISTKKGDFENDLVHGGMFLHKKHNKILEKLFSKEFKNKFPRDWGKVSSSS